MRGVDVEEWMETVGLVEVRRKFAVAVAAQWMVATKSSGDVLSDHTHARALAVRVACRFPLY